MAFLKTVRLPVKLSTIETLISGYVCGAVIGFMMFSVTSEVIGRFAFNHSFRGLPEIASLSMVGVVFLSLGFIQRNNQHITMDLLENKLSKRRIGLIVRCLILVLSAIVSVIACYVSSSHALVCYIRQYASMTIYWSYWPFAALVPIGLFLLTIRLGVQIRGCFKEHETKTIVRHSLIL